MASESGKRPARLFTPGPLTTAPPVREAMQVDFGSRDPQFINIIRNVRSGVLDLMAIKASVHFDTTVTDPQNPQVTLKTFNHKI